MSKKSNTTQQSVIQTLNHSRQKINAVYLQDEAACINSLISLARNDHVTEHNIEFRARDLVDHVRDNIKKQGTIEAFIHEYSLSSEEGVVLMCLAEALLRIPDNETADRLIRDKIAPAEWHKHQGVSRSLFVNASTWGLMLTGNLVNIGKSSSDVLDRFSGLVSRIGEPVARTVLRQAMKLMGSQYVMGTSIETAVERSEKEFHNNYRFSFDMLGEAALSQKDADSYLYAYQQAINYIGSHFSTESDIFIKPSISIKLSALHPRYEFLQKQRILSELTPNILSLIELARSKNVAVTLDAEEADRLDLSLDVFQSVKLSEKIKGWDGFGLAVQAYQKRAYAVLEYLSEISNKCHSKIPVRLVKGAYWDTEIKRAQEAGLCSYPVFTRKSCTDVSYLACAKYLLGNGDHFYPQFATHNAHTVAAILELADDNLEFEFQRLHGMGESLYASVIDKHPCRVYAPVGSYKDLLPYLVRRLLENGANSSFVNRIEDESILVDHIIANPVDKVESFDSISNPHIPTPNNLFHDQRPNSQGVNLADKEIANTTLNSIKQFQDYQWSANSVNVDNKQNLVKVINPAKKQHLVGCLSVPDEKAVDNCLVSAIAARENWKASDVLERVNYVRTFAEILQKNASELYALLIYEAGKTLQDAISELREAIDFCYYYAMQAEQLLVREEVLPGPTGEKNIFQLHGRGVFICISPWNFPLAIFAGQVVAALITGNIVIAKPSGNTTLVASRVVELLYEAGIPKQVLYLLPCSGSVLSKKILASAQVDGVVFTGSFETAININQVLMARKSHIVPLIAETGGLNAMIVDSSALPEQVVKDVITSAFNSAGQRCSALRVLILQKDIYDRMLELLTEAMKELQIGDPLALSTDIPPVINHDAKQKLDNYKNELTRQGKLIYELETVSDLDEGNYVSPALFRISQLSELGEEQFGPLLHVMSFESGDLVKVVDEINDLGYGLTLGVHSRINETIDYITQHANVGNLYVNRNMVGAVVGVQPFGGEGLSGTGPKAGGPNYLQRFCTEKTITVNTAAVGGNASLLALNDD